MMLTDVYQGLGDVPRGTIKQLRVIQILPKTTHLANTPRVGLALEENARAILGTVPVEPDGSARFLVPAMKPILFQALDEDGFAYQTMRTVTYVQPGERVACFGCHESRLTTPANHLASAFHRPASTIDAGSVRWPAVLLHGSGPADPERALRALPRAAETGRQLRPVGHAARRFRTVVLGTVR